MTNSYQGLASYTTNEIAALQADYADKDGIDAFKTAFKMTTDALEANSMPIEVVKTISTSGDAVEGGGSSNTGTVGMQGTDAYTLAQAYEIDGNSTYLTKAETIMMDWAKGSTPTSDPIANAGLISMFDGYDMIRNSFTTANQTTMDSWMQSIGSNIITGQGIEALSKGQSAINNHQSFALEEVGTIGMVTGDTKDIQYLVNGFLKQVGELHSFAGEPAALGVDFNERHAIHYVAYNLQALIGDAILIDRLANVAGNPFHINYNPFTVNVDGGSIQNTLGALMPYETGALKSTNEFSGSDDKNDSARIADGSLNKVYQPIDGLPALQEAQYFTSTITANGTSYNLAQVAATVMKGDHYSVLTTTEPNEHFLTSNIESASSHTLGLAGTSLTVTL